MKRDELQPEWERIVDIGFNDYNKLTKSERVWFNVEPLITNGIIDHYLNYGAENNSDTIEDLETLNFTKGANLLLKVNLLFPTGKPLTDIDERVEQMEDLGKKHSEYLDNIDNEFWLISDELEKRLESFINESIIGQ